MPNWKKLLVSGSDGALNSLIVSTSTTSPSITGSLFGTSSWAQNAVTSSYVLNAVSSSNAATASSADNFTVRGTLTAQTIVAQTITSSTLFVTGSSRFGSLSSSIHQFTGSVRVSGSMNLAGPPLPLLTPPLNFSASLDYNDDSDGYFNEGYTFSFRIYSYKNTLLGRNYSSYTEVSVTDDANYDTQYVINLTWTSNPNADGYLILIQDDYNGYNFDGGYSTTSTSLQVDMYTNWSSVPTITSNSILQPPNILNVFGDTNITGAININQKAFILDYNDNVVIGTSNYTASANTNNIFIGQLAGYQATNANSSNFLGTNAGYQATTANSSNFLGERAGYQATNAYGSNFLGSIAGYGATNAVISNFLGTNAGYQATNAYESNFIGNAAGYQATNANNSNFLGTFAGVVATKANNSNFLGQYAGYGAASASYSTLIGYRVAYNFLGPSRSIKSNNIIIGTNITLDSGRQDSINIGGLIFGTGSYSTLSINAFSGSANGRIGINQPLPIFSLDVSGSGRYTNGLQVTGSLNAPIITGSLFGTSSWAQNAVTASFFSGSIANAISASYAASSSWAINSLTSSYAVTFNVSQSLTASGLRYPTADNGEESFIQTDGTGSLSLQYVKTVYEEIYNGEATTIVKGTPVYISGSVGANARVFRAEAANPLKMPVVYVSADTIASGATGRGIALGLIKGVNTTGYPAGTEIFVGAAGGWTSTRPTGSAIIQVLGYVTKEGSGGQGVILNPGPVNLPNIASGNVWIGNGNSAPIAISSASLFVLNAVSSSFAATASSADNFTVRGTLTAQTIVAQTITSSTDFVTGSTRFGTLLSNTHQFTGSVSITGSASLNGSSIVAGSGTTNTLPKFTGSSSIGNSLLSDISGELRYTGADGFRVQGSTDAFTSLYGTANNYIQFIDAAGAAGAIRYNHTDDFLAFNVNGNIERMRITSAGNVGIGTTITSHRLHVQGAVGENATLAGIYSGTNTARGLTIGLSADGLANDAYVVYTSTIGSGYGGHRWVVDGAERMRITSTGNVGIGTTSPSFNLDISAPLPQMRLISSIGTDASVYRAQNTGGTMYLALENSTGTSFSTGAPYSMNLYHSGNYPILFHTNSTQRMRITGAGDVGIGTTSPSEKLHVNGNAIITGFLALSSSLHSAGGNTATAGTTTTILTVATGSYRAGFFDYTVSSGSNARAGTVMSVWNGSSVEFTDNSTLSIGSTSDIVMSVTLSGGSALLRSTTTTSAWTVRTTYRLI